MMFAGEGGLVLLRGVSSLLPTANDTLVFGCRLMCLCVGIATVVFMKGLVASFLICWQIEMQLFDFNLLMPRVSNGQQHLQISSTLLEI